MKKRTFYLSMLILLPLLSGCGVNDDDGNETFTVVDAVNRTVEIKRGTNKVACIGSGALRIFSYVGDADMLVGIEDYEKSTPSYSRPYIAKYGDVNKYQSIGPGLPGNEPSYSKLIMANPDVIFTTYSSTKEEVEKLASNVNNIPVVALSYYTNKLFNKSTLDTIRLIGKVINKEERGNQVAKYIENIEKDLNNRTKDIKNPKTVFMGCQNYRGSFGIGATNGSVPMFDALNIINAAKNEGFAAHGILTKSRLLALDPDYIILDGGGLENFKEDYKIDKKFYDLLKAFNNNEVYIEMPYNFYSTNIEVALANCYFLGKSIYPEQFSDITPSLKYDEISEYMLGVKTYSLISGHYGEYRQFIHNHNK